MANNNSIYHDSLVKQLQKALEEVQGEVENSVNKTLIESAKNTVKALKQASPKSKGSGKHYANGWTYGFEADWSGTHVVIYNNTKPQLTHLLNNGFIMRNGQRHSGDGHIDEAEEIAIRDVERGLKEL